MNESKVRKLVVKYDELYHNYVHTITADRELRELNRLLWEQQQQTMLTLFGFEYVGELATACASRHHAISPGRVNCSHEPGRYDGWLMPMPPNTAPDEPVSAFDLLKLHSTLSSALTDGWPPTCEVVYHAEHDRLEDEVFVISDVEVHDNTVHFYLEVAP